MASSLFAGVTHARAAAPDAGAGLYARLCANCHGARLEGSLGPALMPGLATISDDSVLEQTIREGRPGSGMPAMGAALSDDAMRALIAFLRTDTARSDSVIAPPDARSAKPPEPILTTEHHTIKVETVTNALETPWSIAFLPDGTMLVTEKEGRLRILDRDGLRPEAVAGTPTVWHIQQGGLLDVAVHPLYRENGWIYLVYSSSQSGKGGMVTAERGRLRSGTWTDRQIVFSTPPGLDRPGGAQFGSRLAFDQAGHLFITVGDRDFPGDAQDLSRPNGKIHRIDDDGSIPADNPFRGRPGALPSIWTLGHRNPQGLAVDPTTGQIWSAEHGPRGGDELNLVEPGRNYGWPIVTYGKNYDGTPVSDRTSAEGMEEPVRQWTPSLGVCALAFYEGRALPAWRHHLFLTTLVKEDLIRLEIAGDRVVHEEVVLRGLGRVRHITTGPDGFLYVALNQPDRIIRLAPAGPTSKNTRTRGNRPGSGPLVAAGTQASTNTPVPGPSMQTFIRSKTRDLETRPSRRSPATFH